MYGKKFFEVSPNSLGFSFEEKLLRRRWWGVGHAVSVIPCWTKKVYITLADASCTSFERLRRPLSPQGESLELQSLSPPLWGKSFGILLNPSGFSFEEKLSLNSDWWGVACVSKRFLYKSRCINNGHCVSYTSFERLRRPLVSPKVRLNFPFNGFIHAPF